VRGSKTIRDDHIPMWLAVANPGLADFLTGVYPDRMEARSAGENAQIRLIFSG
jgi:hypothetical protein